MADWHDYNEDYSDGFASQPDETQDDMLASEFAGVDAISRGIFEHDNKESSAWRHLDKLQDVHFNFATFFEGLQRCYRDLLLGHVHVRSHFGRFVQYFEDIMEAGSVPEFYIIRVQSLQVLENLKLLLPRLEGNMRSRCKARIKIVSAELELFKADAFTVLSAQFDSQADEIKSLQARVRDLEAQLDATYTSSLLPFSSSSTFVDSHTPKQAGKMVKCHTCQIIRSVDFFSITQVGRRKGRRCNPCLRQAAGVSTSMDDDVVCVESPARVPELEAHDQLDVPAVVSTSV